MSSSDIFLPSFGNRPAELIGRDEIISNFTKGLSQTIGHPNRATLLIGQRGMGKTALLLEFASCATSAKFIVARATVNQQMLDDIVGMIQQKGEQYLESHSKSKKIRGVSAGAFGFSFGLTLQDSKEPHLTFLNKMLALCDELEYYGLGLVILIDEVQSRSAELQILATTYQHLIGEGKNVVLAMAGLPHAVSSFLNDEMLTFFNRASKVPLEPLNLNEISVYYAKVFDGLGLTINSTDLKTAVDATRGYPYLLQLIGYYILNYAPSDKEIDSDVVDKAIVSARSDLVDNIFTPVLKPLSPKDRQFLQAMVKDKGQSKISAIAKRLEASDALVQTYRKRLIDMGVIASEQRGYVSLVVPYLDEYLRGEF